MSLPQLYTSRFFTTPDVLSGELLVPVDIAYEPPIFPLPFALKERVGLLAPAKHMLRGSLAEWRPYSYAFWQYLDDVGVERIREELGAIAHRHPGKELVLLDYENMELGQRSHRAIFARWWEESTGQPVYELTNDGHRLHWSQLHKQSKPLRPKDHDARWTDDPVFEWPLSHEQVTQWLAGKHWQVARSKENPHSYCRRDWGRERTFELVVLHMREHGEQEIFGGLEYTYYVATYYGASFKHWTMGDGLAATVILNRKEIDQGGSEELPRQANHAPRAQPKLSDREES